MHETQETRVPCLDQEDPWERGLATPLQYSCLENPVDRGAWRARVQGVTKSQTWLKQLSTHAGKPSEASPILNRQIVLYTSSAVKRLLTLGSTAHDLEQNYLNQRGYLNQIEFKENSIDLTSGFKCYMISSMQSTNHSAWHAVNT